MNSPIISIDHCAVRLGPGHALKDTSWQVMPGQHWALLGGNGAGKTTLMRLVRGDVHPAQGRPFGHEGRRSWDFGDGPTESALDARANIALISSDDQDAWVRSDRGYTGEELVCTGIYDTLALWGEPMQEDRDRARAQLEAIGAGEFADRNVLELSRGQGRLVHIARAMVRRPRILLLDEALEGLDQRMRQRILDALTAVAASGTQIILSTHHLPECPPFLTHAALMCAGTLERTGTATELLARDTPITCAPTLMIEPPRPTADSGVGALLHLEGVSVIRGGRKVLSDINWTVRPGEHWAVLGANGAGKSTLAALATGELRPTTGALAWFGQSDLVNVWNIRKRIGLVSPELQAKYRYNITGLELVTSGFFSSIGLYDRANARQIDRASQCLALTGMQGFEDRPIRSLSYGQIRRLIIARAMVTRPPLLILDEPCAGLDPAARAGFLEGLEALETDGTTLICISHRPEEIPANIQRALVLEQGVATYCGPLDRAPGQR
ncbi:ATP-binding cassette domain-containing protein [Desulfovibrio ferrophilus]|uniref:ABC-type molybdenum transport system, ATPase component/photorepair protein PhrA n=1 Tax=Desulfovibrio ferrophilus TaxID=241368 RepID=A0A2Z6AUD1_9BACT|nr:ATP-binding cassette domain-containing protein [Desulfovibrio ferrophilus]BBD06842.1 ABC-type molybdenum transport system, ATPase component/photorepair protein PhrA [Desulfovibrio ferrophilus]